MKNLYLLLTIVCFFNFSKANNQEQFSSFKEKLSTAKSEERIDLLVQLAFNEGPNKILASGSPLNRQLLLLAFLILSLLIIFLIQRNYRLQKQLAKEKAQFQQQLMTQEKMAALGQITAGIAHEIKNPLNFVNNFAEGSVSLAEELIETIEENGKEVSKDQLEDMIDLVGEFKQNAHDILFHGKRADRIVNSMMAHTRNEKGNEQMTDLNQLLQDSVHLAYHGYRANEPDFVLNIEQELDPKLPHAKVVSQDVSRVLLNIVNNACYAINQKRKADNNGYQPTLFTKTVQEANWLKVHIRDNGPGISDEVKEKIFTPFFTTKPTGSGNTGLGLSISYEIIVDEHQGKLEVNSEQGEFTEFIISLPN